MAATGVFQPSYILGRPTPHSTSETLDLHRLKTEHMLSSARPAALWDSFVIWTLLIWLSTE